jgi:tetratricopeptide (TPR) repeat protein
MRLPFLVVFISLTWSANLSAQQAKVNVAGSWQDGAYILSEKGDGLTSEGAFGHADGHFTGPYTFVMSWASATWTATVSLRGDRIDWNNNTTWRRSGSGAQQTAADPKANNATPRLQRESTADLIGKLSPQQKHQFDAAGEFYNDKQYSEALAIYKQLLGAFPGDAILSKYAGQAALNTGDTGYALNILKPVAQNDPGDWQAVALLTRACAESNDIPCRDSRMTQMRDLQVLGAIPPTVKQYIVERVKIGENSILIRIALEPWGQYNTYASGEVSNSKGEIVFTAAIESNAVEQATFAKEHSDQAAQGFRKFSLDGYQETGVNSQGQRTQTHYTYKFLVERPPSYESIREEFLKIATGKTPAISNRTNLIVP